MLIFTNIPNKMPVDVKELGLSNHNGIYVMLRNNHSFIENKKQRSIVQNTIYLKRNLMN